MPRGLIGLGRGVGPGLLRRADNLRYQHRLMALFDDVWDVSGTSVVNLKTATHTATAGSLTFGQPGIGDGKTAATLAGSGNPANLHSAALSTDFNGEEGTIFIVYKPAAVGVWSDATGRGLLRFRIDDQNDVRIFKSSGANTLGLIYTANNVTTGFSPGLFHVAGWQTAAVTYSKSANKAIGFWNNVPVDQALAGVGDWVEGALSNTSTVAGGLSTVANIWNGSIAYICRANRALTLTEMMSITPPQQSDQYPVFFGDSITAGQGASTAANRWPRRMMTAQTWTEAVISGIPASRLQLSGFASGLETYAPRLFFYRPSKIFILYGVNDIAAGLTAAGYQSALDTIVAACLSRGVNPADIIIGSPPYFTTGANAPLHAQYVTACSTVATNRGTKYADVYQAMVDGGGATLISADGVHPNDNGHLMIHNTMLAAM